MNKTINLKKSTFLILIFLLSTLAVAQEFQIVIQAMPSISIEIETDKVNYVAGEEIILDVIAEASMLPVSMYGADLYLTSNDVNNDLINFDQLTDVGNVDPVNGCLFGLAEDWLYNPIINCFSGQKNGNGENNEWHYVAPFQMEEVAGKRVLFSLKIPTSNAGEVEFSLEGKRSLFSGSIVNVPFGGAEITRQITVLSQNGDEDEDGVINVEDNCPMVANSGQEDENGFEDGDGIGDACEDQDGDGVADGIDNCPGLFNDLQDDTDEDGFGNSCDDDDDNDGICDLGVAVDEVCSEGPDNCPFIANEDQSNVDGDVSGDACDQDADNDGVINLLEGDLGKAPLELIIIDNCPLNPNGDCEEEEEESNCDVNFDGVVTEEEEAMGNQAMNDEGIGLACAFIDGDGDGVNDGDEPGQCVLAEGQEYPEGAVFFNEGLYAGCRKGDLNSDGFVNFDDYSPFLDHYDVNGELDSLGDFNGDDLVNFDDYSPFLDQYDVG